MIVALIVVVLVLAAYGGAVVNRLVSLRRQTQVAFGQIDLQLKRRCDAIPNLVELVKREISGERETLEKLAQARTEVLNARTVVGKAAAESHVRRAVESVLALAQTHPELGVDDELISAYEALRATQNKISFAGQYYNDIATKYNERLDSFPSSVIASLGHFTPIDLFEVEATPQREPARAV